MKILEELTLWVECFMLTFDADLFIPIKVRKETENISFDDEETEWKQNEEQTGENSLNNELAIVLGDIDPYIALIN